MRLQKDQLFLAVLMAAPILSFIALNSISDDLLGSLLGQVSRDEHVDNVDRARTFLENALLFAGIIAVWIGLIRLDAGSARGRQTNSNFNTWSARIGLLLSSLSIAAFLLHRFGFPQPFVFRKEGFLEILSAILFLVASALFLTLAVAALRSRDGAGSNWVLTVSALAAFACFFVGMEEISWGQHYLRFDTPDWMEARNYQSEMTVHNILPKDVLDWVSILILWGILGATCLMFVSSRLINHKGYRMICPDAYLVGLVILTVFVATRLHLDPAEFLLSVAAFYYASLLHSRVHSHRDGEPVAARSTR